MEPCDRQDTEKRLESIEHELKAINATLNQVAGVWYFLKLVAGIGTGCAILYNAFHSLFTK